LSVPVQVIAWNDVLRVKWDVELYSLSHYVYLCGMFCVHCIFAV